MKNPRIGSDGKASHIIPKPFASRSLDRGIVLLLIAAVCASLVSLSRLRFDAGFSVTLRQNQGTLLLEQARRQFPEESLVVLALPSADPFSRDSLGRLIDLEKALSEHSLSPADDKVWRLHSPINTQVYELRGEELAARPLVGGYDDPPSEIEARLGKSPLAKRLFLPDDAGAWSVILNTTIADVELVSIIKKVKKSFPELRVAGMPYWEALYAQALRSELPLLLSAASAVLFLIELWTVRHVASALILWAFSLMPTLFLFAFFVLLDEPLRPQNILAPILTLALTTSYVTHYYRAWAEGRCDPRAALKSHASILALDAATTVLGFGSLLVSPVKDLQVLGLIAIVGALLSLFTVLAGFSAALGVLGRPSAASTRFRELAGRKSHYVRRPTLRIIAWAVLLCVCAAVSLGIQAGSTPKDFFWPWSRAGRDVAWFDERFRGLDEAAIIIDTQRENGIVDVGFFESIERIQREIGALRWVDTPYSYVDLVAEAVGAWKGSGEPVMPKSAEEIGEAVTLLGQSGNGLLTRGILDEDWSAVKIHVPTIPGFNYVSDFPRLTRAADSLIARELRGLRCSALWAGSAAERSLQTNALIKGQISGTLLYFALILPGLSLVLRSPRKAALVALVPVAGFVSALALVRIMGWNLNVVNAIALAAIAGTGIDNAIILALRGGSDGARSASFDTTFLVVAAILVFAFTSGFLVSQAAVVCAFGIASSAATALWTLPALRGEGRAGG